MKFFEAPALDWDEDILGGLFADDLSFIDLTGRSCVYVDGNNIVSEMEDYK